MKSNQTEVKVYYADTDHGGVAYYANYLKWFEIGRTELLDDAKLDFAHFEKKDLIVAVVDVHCEYKMPAVYNDTIVIKTSVEKIGYTSITFLYEILRKKDNELIAKGTTVNVFVDKKQMKAVQVPEEIKEYFG